MNCDECGEEIRDDSEYFDFEGFICCSECVDDYLNTYKLDHLCRRSIYNEYARAMEDRYERV